MSGPKLLVLGLLVAALSFFAAFVPSIALGMRDADAVSTTELTLLPPVPHQPAPSSAAQDVAATPRAAKKPNVDPDCYGDGTVCKKDRITDVEDLAMILAPVLSSHGWPSGCFEVRIAGGDAGESDALSISVSGKPGLGVGRCREHDAGGAPKPKLVKLANDLKGLVAATKNAQNVDLLQVTDGVDVDVQIALQ